MIKCTPRIHNHISITMDQRASRSQGTNKTVIRCELTAQTCVPVIDYFIDDFDESPWANKTAEN